MKEEKLSNNIRKFEHVNIVKHLDASNLEKLQSEIERDYDEQAIITNNIKITPGSKSSLKNYIIKSILVPNSNYTLIKDHLLQAYKVIKMAKNEEKINKVFLISTCYNYTDSKILLSCYNGYETILKNIYKISDKVYETIQDKNSKVKQYISQFEKTSFYNTVFHEENNVIKETNEEIIDCLEDNDFSFDIHLMFINLIFKTRKIEIVPLWINISNTQIIENFNDCLKEYMNDETSLFIYSTNISYFGRMYNYYGESKYKNKTFLKDKLNEKEIFEFLKNLDESMLDNIKSSKINGIYDTNDHIYSKNVLLFFSIFIKRINQNGKFDLEKLYYNIIHQEYNRQNSSSNSDFEFNLITFMTLAVVKAISN